MPEKKNEKKETSKLLCKLKKKEKNKSKMNKKKKKKTNATEDPPMQSCTNDPFQSKKSNLPKITVFSNLLYNYFKYNNYRLHLLLCNARWFSVSVTTTILLIIIFIWIYIHTQTHTP